MSSPEAPNSSTPGACAAGTAFSAASATSPRLTARANSDDAPATRFHVGVGELGLAGVPYEDQRSPARAVGDEGASQFGTKAAGVAEARAALRTPGCRLAYRGGSARTPRQLLELVDVGDRVFVVGKDLEAIRKILEPVLRDQIRARIQGVPAGPVKGNRSL